MIMKSNEFGYYRPTLAWLVCWALDTSPLFDIAFLVALKESDQKAKESKKFFYLTVL